MADETSTPTEPTTPRPQPTAPIKDAAGSAGPAATPSIAETVEKVETIEQSAARTIKDGAAKMAKEATGKARGYIEDSKTRAGGALDEVSRLMGDAADTVDERLGPQYGQYARSAAEGIAGFSENLKGKDVEELLADAQRLVRKSPAVAIGLAAALGFVVARLVKAGLETPATMASETPPTAPHPAPTEDA